MAKRGPAAARQAAVGDADAVIEKPKTLSAEASRIWDALVPRLRAMGLLIEVDAVLLESLCQYRAQWLAYTARLADMDPATQEHRRITQSANDSHTRLERCLAECGMTPNSRARMRLEQRGDERDELEIFLQQKGKR